MWFEFFRRPPRCAECHTTEDLHQVEEGIHKSYVCSRCAITTGYVNFLPTIIVAIQQQQKEANQ